MVFISCYCAALNLSQPPLSTLGCAAKIRLQPQQKNHPPRTKQRSKNHWPGLHSGRSWCFQTGALRAQLTIRTLLPGQCTCPKACPWDILTRRPAGGRCYGPPEEFFWCRQRCWHVSPQLASQHIWLTGHVLPCTCQTAACLRALQEKQEMKTGCHYQATNKVLVTHIQIKSYHEHG